MTFDWFRRRFNQQDEEPKAAEPEPAPEPEVAEEAPAAPPPAIAEDYLSWAKAAYQNIQKRQQEPSEATSEEPPRTEALETAQETAPESPIPSAESEAPGSELEPSEPETPEPELSEATPIAEESPAIAESPETTEISSEVEVSEVTNAQEVFEPEVQPEVAGEPVEEPGTETSTLDISTDSVTNSVEAAEAAIAPPAEPELVEPEFVETGLATDSATIAPEISAAPPASAPAPTPAAPLPFWAQSEADRLERLERLKETAIVEPEPEPKPQPTSASQTQTPVPLPDFTLDEGFLWSAEILAAQGRRPEEVSIEEITWLNRLRQGLDKTRRGLVNQLRSIVGQGPLNQDAVLEIEAALLQADVGVAATDAIIEALQTKLRNEVLPPDAAITYLKQILREMLDAPLQNSQPFFAPQKDVLNIWLITGVNGAGKTTTIGKLAHIARKSDYNCLIAAADTFRAAAVEQVKVWGSRSEVEVIANPGQNTDPAAVVFDAISAAQSRGTELLLVDTAGRLQNKKNLMDELSKVRRIIDKKAGDSVVESLLVLDATLGQNGLRQAEVFSQAAQLSGVVLTKLDGTAKGGIALAVVQQLGLPIRFIGAGEGIEDLRPFSSYEFVEALLSG